MMEASPINMPDIHKAARKGKATLQGYLMGSITEKEIRQVYENGTVLHYAASIENKKKATAMMQIILCCSIIRKSSKLCEDLVNMGACDDTGDTALHIAAKNCNREAVTFLLFNGADIKLKNKQGVEPIELMYQNVPDAILPVFDAGIKLKKDVNELTSADEDLQLEIDFGVFAGVSPRSSTFSLRNETNLIQPALNLDSENKSRILSHPIVELFLHYKWNKIRGLIWFSIIFHVIWSLCCSGYFVIQYRITCPYNVTKLSEDGRVPCRRTYITLGLEIAILAMWLVLIAKEIYEYCQSGWMRYIRQGENWGQLLLKMFSVAPLVFPKLPGFYKGLSKWEYPLAACSSTLAFALVLAQVRKLPGIGIYMKMLGTVVKNCFFFMTVYGILLVSFWSSFAILLPERDAFQEYGYVKMSMFLIGEVNFDELFFGGGELELKVPFSFWTQTLFLIVTLIVSIVLANLLIGILVNDIAALQNMSHLSNIETQLREINLMESFWLSGPLQKGISVDWYKRNIIVTSQEEPTKKPSGPFENTKNNTTITNAKSNEDDSGRNQEDTQQEARSTNNISGSGEEMRETSFCVVSAEEEEEEEDPPSCVISLNDSKIPIEIRRRLRAKVKALYFTNE